MSTAPTFNISGLISGMDTNSIIQQLVAIEQVPIHQMQAQQSTNNEKKDAWSALSKLVQDIGDKAAVLSSQARLYAPVTSSSNTAAVTVSGSAPSGTNLAFQVTSLAAASQSAVSGFTSASQVVNGGTVAIGTGLAAIGVSKVDAAGAAAGSHTITVTTSSAAATLTSTVGSAGYTSSGGDLQLSVNGGATVDVTIAAGTYTAAQLASTINAQLSGTGATASVVNGNLTLSTTAEGSAATVSVVGGTEAAGMGLSGTAAGTDGVLSVDGTSVTVTNAQAGATVTAGGLALTLAGGLRAGSASATTVSVSAGATLNDVAAAVNSTGAVSASVLNTGDPTLGTELLFTAKNTGTANATTVSLDGFSQSYQTTNIRSASDATLVMGNQTITRSSNTIADLVPGATLTLLQTTSSDVTISAARDDQAVADKVKSFVDAINSFLTQAADDTKADPTGKNPGILNGDPDLRDFGLNLVEDITNAYGGGTISVLSQIGIRVQRDGTLSFDEDTFKQELAADPNGVANVLSQTGSSTSSQLSFSTATTATQAGAYDVVVTQAASQAQLASSPFTSLASAETFTFTSGTTTVNYSAAAGTSGADLATQLNSAFAAGGLNLTADYSGGQLVVRSKGYGSAATFTASSTNDTLSGTATGTDVAGTINGVAATGTGQMLQATSTTDPSAGLTVQVTSTAADVAAAGGSLNLGNMTVSNGVGDVINALVNGAEGANGMFSNAAATLDSQNSMIQDNIDAANQRVDMYQTQLTNEFAAMEMALARLKQNTPNFAALSGSSSSSSGSSSSGS